MAVCVVIVRSNNIGRKPVQYILQHRIPMLTQYLSAHYSAYAAYVQGVSKQIVGWLIHHFKFSKMCLHTLHAVAHLSIKIEFGDAGLILMDV